MTLGLVFLLGVAGLLVAPGADAVPGSATGCNNEPRIDQGGDDLLVEAGPGVAYVGVDRGTLAGGSITVCVGAPSLGIATDTSVDDDDIPQTRNEAGCVVDVLGCRVTAFTVWGHDDDGRALATSHRSGLPAGNGTTNVYSPVNCVVGVGTSC